MRHVRVRWAVGLVGLAVAASVLPGLAFAADDQPPVSVPDEVTLLPGGSHHVDVMRNDTDDLGQQGLCRARGSADVEASLDRGRVFVNVPTDQPGDYEVQYQACDYDYLSVGTVTVHAVAPQAITVEQVPGQPGVLRATNPNPVRVLLLWVRPHSERLSGHFKLPAGASQDFTVDSRRIVWVAIDPSSYWEDGSILGYGRIKDITLPRSTRRPAHLPASRYDVLWRSVRNAPATHAHGAEDRDAAWPTDPTTVQPPVPRVDTIHWWSGSWDRVPVTANDTDPQGQRIDVCRLAPEATVPAITASLTPSVIDGRLDLGTGRHVEGTWKLPYYVCNDGRLAPALLRVVVVPADPLQVERLTRDPHLVRIHNPNDAPADYTLGRRYDQMRFGRVGAHGTRTVRLPLGAHRWEGRIGPHGGYAGSGTIG